jgi:hypothetical protein
MAQYIVSLALVGILPILLITLFSKLDTEVSDKLTPNKLDYIIILLISIAYTVITAIKIETNIYDYINMSILFGYLVFMSYTDQKLKMLYSIVSVLMILLETSWLTYSCFIAKSTELTKYHLIAIPILILLTIVSKLGYIGFGDVLIYFVYTIYETIYTYISFWYILLSLLISNILFLVVTVIRKLITHNKEKKQPYTIYIAISIFIVNIFLV